MLRMMNQWIKFWLLVFFFGPVASLNASAASILIDGDNINGLYTFTFSQFEGGFSINGSTPTSGGSFTFGDGTQTNFNGQWLDLGQATLFSRTVYWVDPNTPTKIDQVLNWNIAPSGIGGLATISGFFFADQLNIGADDRVLPASALPGDVIVEQLAGGHNPFIFTAPFLTGQVLADSPRSLPPVPVPAAFWLFGTALVGFVAIARRRRVD